MAPEGGIVIVIEIVAVVVAAAAVVVVVVVAAAAPAAPPLPPSPPPPDEYDDGFELTPELERALASAEKDLGEREASELEEERRLAEEKAAYERGVLVEKLVKVQQDYLDETATGKQGRFP